MSRRRTQILASLAALAAALGLLAGCGGSSSSGNGVAGKSTTQILAATKRAADAAKSVHVSGSLVSGGTPITLDMNLIAGKGGRGQLSQGGLTFELIEVGNTVYIKGSSAFYKHIGGAAAAQLLQGKWLKAASGSSGFASIGQLTNLRALVDQTLADHGTLTKTGTTTINGTKVVGVTDKGKGGTLYIAATGKPYPVQINRSGSGTGTISFDHWDEAVTLAAPANAIDIAQLQAAAK
ncbi:MAG: hypothetical protein QOF54_596 [Solirubrobacteraceae bacterium]|jgi:hypothetical protein|nr:hypothetical protein [Solirubrobacteraceae bacterium]